MKAVVQRVKSAKVVVKRKTVATIKDGLLIYLGIRRRDTDEQAQWMARKIAGLRIFQDKSGRMDKSAVDLGVPCLVVSQFTLYGDCSKGRRPNFTMAAPPDKAEPLYEAFMQELRQVGLTVESGVFGAMMAVHSVNDGPVTMILGA